MWRSAFRRSLRRRDARFRSAVRPRSMLETLESRLVLSASYTLPAVEVDAPDPGLVTKMIVAGDPNGTPADSPGNRIDPNLTTSPYAGVGSLFMDLGTGSGFLCSGTLVSPTHVLTAGHCVDADDNGTNDFAPANITFRLNYGSNLSNVITASAVNVHSDFTGFANPAVNDDLAIIELSSPAPAGVPIYPISTAPFTNIETVTLVGYGTTGDGVNGYISGTASFTTKRVGQNHADAYVSDDEGSGAREVFEWDFDGDHKKTNYFGAPTTFNQSLGNDIETTVGGGDSGGPAFLKDSSGNLTLFAVNTFTSFGKAAAPLFGSLGGGIVVSAYADWINSIVGGVDQPPTANAGPDQNVTTGSLVQLDGSGSSDPEGAALSYSWTLTVPAGSSASLSDSTAINPTFTADVDGAYVATLVVNDDMNESAPDSTTITAGPVAASMHVGDIDGSAPEKGKSGKWSANVTVTIHDSNENLVAGAAVTGEWSGDASGTAVGVTDSLGNVFFTTGNLNIGTSVTFTVTNVTNSLSYNSGANHDPDGDSTGTSMILVRGVGPVSVIPGTIVDAVAVRELISVPLLPDANHSLANTLHHGAVDVVIANLFSIPSDELDKGIGVTEVSAPDQARDAEPENPVPSDSTHINAIDCAVTRQTRFDADDNATDELVRELNSEALEAAFSENSAVTC